jgi:hypothetical protein
MWPTATYQTLQGKIHSHGDAQRLHLLDWLQPVAECLLRGQSDQDNVARYHCHCLEFFCYVATVTDVPNGVALASARIA